MRTGTSESIDASAARFAIWYSHYPIKKARADALKAWRKIDPDDALTERMIVAIENQMAERRWKRAVNIWVPELKLPATWLRKECWEDECEPEAPKNMPPSHPPSRGMRALQELAQLMEEQQRRPDDQPTSSVVRERDYKGRGETPRPGRTLLTER